MLTSRTTTALRMTVPWVRRATALRTFAAEASKVSVLEELEDVETFRKDNPKSVLYFTAGWCPPCKQIKPIYHDLSNTVENVAFGQVDVDENGDAAAEFKISAVPTFVFSEGDTTVKTFAGADPNQLNQYLSDLAGK